MSDRLPAALRAYRLFSVAATPLTPLLLAQRMRRGKEHRLRLPERRGVSVMARPPGPLVWLHGASVGELISVLPLIERIRAREVSVLVTSGTVTSGGLAEQRLPRGVIHQFVPLDVPMFVRRFLDHWQPDLALFAESDLWPNIMIETSQRGVPMILVNGRLSENSFRRWRYLPVTIGNLLRRLDLCLARTPADAERLSELGAPHVVTTGDLKLDGPAPPADRAKLAALQSAIGARPAIAAASTHAGEETAMIDAHRRLRANFPGLLTLIVPRHPERGAGVAEIARAGGLKTRLRSRGELPDATTDIYVADTVGELGIVYRLAPIVFVGGSLVRHGGQNPIEAAKLGAAILHGPHVWNFAEIYAALDQAHGAEPVTDASKLTAGFGALMAQPAARLRVADAARATVEGLSGALERTLQSLDPYLMQLRLRQPAMREPSFWWRKAGLAAGLLAPAAACYGAIAARRMARPGARASVPVLCVGNFTHGGAGKTPAVMTLAKMLQDAGERPFCLSRGYGGSLAGPKLVDVNTDGAAQVGDEALLLARLAPTVIARDRVAGAEAARAAGAGVIVMDDGLQNASLAKDFTIAVIDGRRGLGNACVPAGPLRAPLDAQLARTDALLVVGEATGASAVIAAARGLPVLHGRLVPDTAAVAALSARKVLAFAGIGDPDKFFATAAAAGIAIAQRQPFPDHHRYTAEEAAELIMQAEHGGLALLTTEKDRARMAGEPLLAALAAHAHVLPVALVVDEADELRALVLAKVRKPSS